MSERQVLATVRALLEDETEGLAVTAAAVVAEWELGEGRVRTDYGWDRWVLRGALLPATPRWSVAPIANESDHMHAAKPERAGRHVLGIRGAVVDADTDRLEDWLLVHHEALLRVLDRLEDYSRETGGTIALLEAPSRIAYGSFTGTATEAGLECTISLLERST